MASARPYRTRLVAALLALCAAGVTVSVAASPAPAAPSSPPVPATAADAQDAKNQADRSVADVQARIAAEARRIRALTVAASQAEQVYQRQLAVQQHAQAAADAATAARVRAQRAYRTAHRELVSMIVAQYEDGTDVSTNSTANLLTSDDPNVLLDRLATMQMVSSYHADVTTAAEDAATTMSVAEDQERAALARTRAVTARLAAVHARADAAVRSARHAQVALRAQLAGAKAGQARAVALLSTFLGGWSTADPVEAGALNAHYRALAQQALTTGHQPARSAHWTAALGQWAAYRAMAWIGTPYAWAGGTGAGPTRGVCTGGGAGNDCHVIGFDCSGLALYAWAPYAVYAHFAATQYGAGRVHPAVDELLPGDLVFWSNGGTVAGIHHVAVYIGAGLVVQAPQSGDIVRITPLANVSAGYFGATRPMS